MKLTKICAILPALAIMASAADKLQIPQLPKPVLETLEKAKGSDTVSDIRSVNDHGKTIYVIKFARRGLDPVLRIGADGAILKDSRQDNGVLVGDLPGAVYPHEVSRPPNLSTNDLPESVQKTIQDQAAGRPVADLDKKQWKGQTVYEVEFEQPGRNAYVYVGEDGAIVKEERTGGVSKLFSFHQNLPLTEAPTAVQETINREAAGQKVADLNKRMRRGQPVYDVDIEQPGRDIKLRIADDGAILKDNRTAAGLGSPGRPSQIGTGSVQESHGRNLDIHDVPEAVRNQINARSEGLTLKGIKIQEKTRDGKSVYEVVLQQEGKDTKFQVDETGSIMDENFQLRSK